MDVIEPDYTSHTLHEQASAHPLHGVLDLETTLALLLLAIHEGRPTMKQVIQAAGRPLKE